MQDQGLVFETVEREVQARLKIWQFKRKRVFKTSLYSQFDSVKLIKRKFLNWFTVEYVYSVTFKLPSEMVNKLAEAESVRNIISNEKREK